MLVYNKTFRMISVGQIAFMKKRGCKSSSCIFLS